MVVVERLNLKCLEIIADVTFKICGALLSLLLSTVQPRHAKLKSNATPESRRSPPAFLSRLAAPPTCENKKENFSLVFRFNPL